MALDKIERDPTSAVHLLAQTYEHRNRIAGKVISQLLGNLTQKLLEAIG